MILNSFSIILSVGLWQISKKSGAQKWNQLPPLFGFSRNAQNLERFGNFRLVVNVTFWCAGMNLPVNRTSAKKRRRSPAGKLGFCSKSAKIPIFAHSATSKFLGKFSEFSIYGQILCRKCKSNKAVYAKCSGTLEILCKLRKFLDPNWIQYRRAEFWEIRCFE